MTAEKIHKTTKGIAFVFLSLSILLFIYTYYRAEIFHNGEMADHYYKYYVGIFISSFFWFFVLKLKNSMRSNIVLVCISLLISAYVIEIILHVSYVEPKGEREVVANKENIEFDARTRLQVIQDFKSEGIEVVPSVHEYEFIKSGGLHKENYSLLYPLTGVSNKVTIGANESGKYGVYRSDRYGFNNPDSVWDSKMDSWILIGDAFTLGHAVSPEDNISGKMQQLTGNNVINLSLSGNGPLNELATLKEYGQITNTKKVVWLFCEGNDHITDLASERSVPILMRYLNPDFSQNLALNVSELDERLLHTLAKRELDEKKFQNSLINKTKILRLYNIRKLITFDEPKPKKVEVKVDLLFSEILKTAKNRVMKDSGEIYFVYLPVFERYSSVGIDHDDFRKRKEVLTLVSSLGIPIIDIHKEVFSKHEKPLSLFPLRLPGHYTEEGYLNVAKAIVKGINGYEKSNK